MYFITSAVFEALAFFWKGVYNDHTDYNEFILKKLKIVYFKGYELMTFTYSRANKMPPTTNTKVALKPQ